MHGTHCDDAEIALLAERGATRVRVPDDRGQPRRRLRAGRRLREAGASPVCVGSDSNTILDPLAELRELEHVARRTAERRNVLVADGDDGPAPYLLSCGWAHGARALGLPTPVIEADAPADLIAIDLDHAEIAGVADEHLARRDRDGRLRRARHPHLGRRPLAPDTSARADRHAGR